MARTTGMVDEHRVSLRPSSREPVDRAGGAYRQDHVSARELRLRRLPAGWIGVLDGGNLTPVVCPGAEVPRAPLASELTTVWANDTGLSVRAPADFKVEHATAASLLIVQEELGEVFEVGLRTMPDSRAPKERATTLRSTVREA